VAAQNLKAGGKFLFAGAVVLFLSGLIAYLPGFNAPFTFDDLTSIVQNRWIRMASLSPRSLFDAAFQDFKQNRPLTNLSFALNYYFSQMNPFGYHLVNFCAMLLTAFGVWMVLRKILLRMGYDHSRAELASWLCALVWTVHPVNVQAVTYIVQRHACLAGMFSVWSLYFFHLSLEREERRRTFFILSALSCLFALLSKETTVTLPALLFIYKLYFFDELKPGWPRRNWKPMAALLVFYLAALVFALRPSMRQVAFDFSRMPFGPYQRFLAEPLVLCWYACLVVFPVPQRLSVEHQFFVSPAFFQPAYALIFWAVIFAVIALAVIRAGKNRALSFLLLWYFGQLLVEALPLPIDLAAEHRLYLASLSMIVPAIAGLILKPKNMKPFLALIVAVSLLLAGFTWQRNRLWLSPDMLWRDAVKKSPRFPRTANNYCAALSEKGKCDLAHNACNLAHALSRSLAEPYINLGVCYSKAGREDLAEKAFRLAADLSNNSAPALFNIGMSYSMRHDYRNAQKWFLAAIDKDPFYADSHYGLAQTYRALMRPDEYQRELRETIKLRPEWSEARAQLAWELVAQGNCPEAVRLVKAAPAMDPQLRSVLEQCRFQ